MTGSMGALLAAAVFFVLSHVGLSGTAVRAFLLRRLGRPVFVTFYSVVATAAIVWLVAAYLDAPRIALWARAGWTPYVPFLTMPWAAILFAAGFDTARTTLSGDEPLAPRELAPGILKVTRHPMLWAIALWAGAHILPNGHLAGLVFFGTLLVFSLSGMWLVDAKRRRLDADAFARLAAATSVVPFAATLAGRNHVTLAEIGWRRIAAGLLLYLAALVAHPYVIGASAIPF